ncbi:DUF3168 domain-containing protein [Paragemmobacter ruber]|uniref:DUF3168 domain-containing protein n=1 Tax=Paragemmobacter ruber TaxID=1985673 RepID=A0ABW9Y7X5_9RHOB|nr:DUF3168 domain-containing protein [Rhodobacter ruber]NBE08683.1 DUF3168 domain-containing protein [Rhodobacter ruber]
MSYGLAGAVQVAVHGALAAHPDLAGVAVMDAVPPGGAVGTFVLIGADEVRDASDVTGAGAEHRVEISVRSDAAGFLAAKAVAAAVCGAMEGLALAQGRIVGVWFQKAKAVRSDDGAERRVDLTFRLRVEA